MPDIKFGCQLPQDSDPDHAIETAVKCEQLGYDSVWAYDHLSPYWLRSGRALECWTLLAAVAARTSRIKIGSLVTNINFRNPALLAKMTSSLDNISDGRLIVGLGVGDRLSQSELHRYGYEFRPLNERINRLREVTQILKSMWTNDEASFKGNHFRISHAHNYPKPGQKRRPPIWIGGRHRKVLDVVAEMADGWNCWGLNKLELAQREAYLKSKCVELGRKQNSLVKSWAGNLVAGSKGESNSTVIDEIRGELLRNTNGETDYFIASFNTRASPKAYEAFAEAVKLIG
ncbi:MAG TPA: LLM class flavin-dependent oxidoreductase [Candidatus Acidoferrales bacterium]|nr:LLM class flavin-dependent oxidoreductase [Candidatus Acidoferrales bacterium]